MPRWSSTIRRCKQNALTTVRTARRTGLWVSKFEEKVSGALRPGVIRHQESPSSGFIGKV